MDTSNPISSSAVAPAKRNWRRHSDAFKAQVIALARQPHTSVAAVALANGLNANMLRRWVREAQAPSPLPPTAKPQFVQLPMPSIPTHPAAAAQPGAASMNAPADRAFVEVHRGATAVYVTLPSGANSAAWVREVLR